MTLSKIINFQDQGQAADLFYGVPEGRIGGYHLNDSNNQNWEVAVVGGPSNNEVTLKNAATGTYASPSGEYGGAEVKGSTTPYRWQQLSVTGGWFQFATTDGKYVWYLVSAQDGAPIFLTPTPDLKPIAQWGYKNA